VQESIRVIKREEAGGEIFKLEKRHFLEVWYGESPVVERGILLNGDVFRNISWKKKYF
jgi:hypothetical protein